MGTTSLPSTAIQRNVLAMGSSPLVKGVVLLPRHSVNLFLWSKTIEKYQCKLKVSYKQFTLKSKKDHAV
jgi:hypothetical protein